MPRKEILQNKLIILKIVHYPHSNIVYSTTFDMKINRLPFNVLRS
jgi:hypothetical protein